MSEIPHEDCQILVTPVQHTIINIILLVLAVISYLPQIYSIISRRSTFGHALMHSLLNVLYTTSQLSLSVAVTIVQIPVSACIDQNALTGIRALSASLGLLQTTTLWIGSLVLFSFFFIYPDHTPPDCRIEPVSPYTKAVRQYDPETSRTHPRAALAVVITWTTIFLIPLAALAFPKPTRFDFGIGIFGGACMIVLTFTVLIFLIAQYIPQIRLMHRLRDELETTSINPWTLGLQLITFVPIGVSSRFYFFQLLSSFLGAFRPPPNGPWHWYTGRGWRWINYIIFGVGQGILLCLYVYYRYKGGARPRARVALPRVWRRGVTSGSESSDERTPLIWE